MRMISIPLFSVYSKELSLTVPPCHLFQKAISAATVQRQIQTILSMYCKSQSLPVKFCSLSGHSNDHHLETPLPLRAIPGVPVLFLEITKNSRLQTARLSPDYCSQHLQRYHLLRVPSPSLNRAHSSCNGLLVSQKN